MHLFHPINFVIILLVYVLGRIIDFSNIRNEYIPLLLTIFSLAIYTVINVLIFWTVGKPTSIESIYKSLMIGFIVSSISITIRQFQIQWRKLNTHF